jgi:CO/xanthine dehydrogenase FAD-binding subunit
VSVHRPNSIAAALAALAAAPDALVLAGGTDVMVGVNEGHRRPADVVALAGTAERAELHRETVGDGGIVRREHVGAGLAGHERLDREFDSERHDTPP